MYNGYNLYNLEPEFKNFLIAVNISPISLKNYLSDFRHFCGWLEKEFRIKNLELRVGNIDITAIDGYKTYLINNDLPVKTINRRLSTLRKFCSFCISQGWLKENPAKKITNYQLSITSTDKDRTLKQFKSYLMKQNKDQKTIINYLDDVKEFLSL